MPIKAHTDKISEKAYNKTNNFYRHKPLLHTFINFLVNAIIKIFKFVFLDIFGSCKEHEEKFSKAKKVQRGTS